MRQKISRTILFSLLLVGCGSLPPKPDVDLCSIDAPRDQLLCSPTNKVQSVDDIEHQNILKMIDEHPGRYKIPFNDADKYICFSPEDWSTVSTYMKTLRDKVERQCGK